MSSLQYPMPANEGDRSPRIIHFEPSVDAPHIVLDGVYVDYPGHPDALRNVSLKISRGERVAVIGPSGSGKSTLLKTLNGLLPIARGARAIHLRGTAGLASSNSSGTHENVSMVFQEFALAQRLPVLANVLVGALGRTSGWRSLLGWFHPSDREQAMHYIKAVGLHGLEHKRVDQLSSGQKQRVAIARALMQEHELLLADEPVASLDLKTSFTTLNLISTLQEQLRFTLLISLHDIDHVRGYCSRVVGVSRGRIVFDGPTSTLDQHALETIFGGGDVVEHRPHS
jgi:phosphonate transport system ATP-binding protein